MKKSYFDPSNEILSKPAPNNYNPDETLTTNSRFNEITLGYGQKMLGHYSPVKAEKTPGPGEYIKDFSWT